MNKKLYASTVSGGRMKYDDWLKSHQPFHWLAKYYDIINGNGGFDVIIGNPPYVEYNKKVQGVAVSDIYKLNGYITIECGNLYAFIIERCYSIISLSSMCSYIIPSASICTPRMKSLYNILITKGNLWTSIWDERPSKLFDGVDQQLCIQISTPSSNRKSYITRMNHWVSDNRHTIFHNISYTNYTSSDIVALVAPKIQDEIEKNILKEIHNDCVPLSDYVNKTDSNSLVYYKNAGGRYWRLVKTFPTYFSSPTSNTTTTEKVFKTNIRYQRMISVLLSSSLFYWFWRVVSNCRHLTNREIEAFVIAKGIIENKGQFDALCNKYEDSLRKNKKRSVTQNKSTGEIVQDFYFCRLSKPIIDEIDKVLAKHYGFTEEELDFIINYDIKYRMGDELNDE